MASFFSRFGSVGRLPDALRRELEPEGIIHVAEKVRVRKRFSGSVPGLSQGFGASRQVALVVITGERIYALLPTSPGLKQPVLDQRWDVNQDGPVAVAISASGIQVDFAIRRIDPRFHGELSLHFAVDLDDAVLAQLPATKLRYSVSPEYVFHLLGVRAR